MMPVINPAEPLAQDLRRWLDARRRNMELVEYMRKPMASEPPSGDPSFVYCIMATGTNSIKIGMSRNPAERIKQLSTGCPVRLRLVGMMAERAGCMGNERKWHNEFRNDCVNGEWFEYSDRLKAAVHEHMEIVVHGS